MRPWVQRVLATPAKHSTRRPVDFLNATRSRVCCEPRTGRRGQGTVTGHCWWWPSRTGLRASDLIHLRFRDAQFGPGADLRCLR